LCGIENKFRIAAVYYHQQFHKNNYKPQKSGNGITTFFTLSNQHSSKYLERWYKVI